MDSKENILWKEWFFQKEFSVDKCLSQYTQKSDLNTLKQDLKNYGNELQSHMSSILKTETEAIVNLAEYLTNLNSKIDNLSVPISQLREEIRTLYDLVGSAESNYSEILEKLKANNKVINHFQLKLGIISYAIQINNIIDSIDFEDLVSLERTVHEFSFQKTYIDELNLEPGEAASFIEEVEKKLIDKVNKKFLSSFKNNDKTILLMCLRMYENLRKQEEAQKTFQVHIVKSAIRHLFSESYLEKCNNNVDIIYNEVLQFLYNGMSILHEIVDENPELKLFNFVLNSFWAEFDKQSREGLPYITAPGNPELFQRRFTSTWKLLIEIARKAGSENLVTQDDSFQEHIKRFNLPVYFEIIFQQIAGDFEADIFGIDINSSNIPKNESNFKLRPTMSLWKGIMQCFNGDIYIDQLSDQFLRLSMMLLSRYLKWFDKVLGATNAENVIVDSVIDLNAIEKLVSPNLSNPVDIKQTLFSIVNPKMWPIVLKIFSVNRKVITTVRNNLRDKLRSLKFKQCSAQLQNVGSIPRLYRRTNRTPPKEASQYMIEAVKPVLAFHEQFGDINVEHLDHILDDIIIDITKHYIHLVQEVLLSVCKTEESLRKLKTRNVMALEESSQSQTDTMSDEVKIREQIKFDVSFFLEKLYPLGSTRSRETMEELRNGSC